MLRVAWHLPRQRLLLPDGDGRHCSNAEAMTERAAEGSSSISLEKFVEEE
jgi:hypothetical protein